MSERLNNKPLQSSMAGSDTILGIFGGKVGRMTIDNFRQHLNDNSELFLEEVAFFVDANTAGSSSTRVNVGGSALMLRSWLNEWRSALMGKDGDYVWLNPNDERYTESGTPVVQNGAVVAAFANCQFMGRMPKTYTYVQNVTVSGKLIQRFWYSLIPLGGGGVIEEQWAGMFKLSTHGSKAWSQPNYVPHNSVKIDAFWNLAQAYGKDWGLANHQYQLLLIIYMMAKYGQRSSQQVTATDGSLVWGPGLDGTENTTGSASDGFARQKNIKTGATLSIGTNDGKVAVTDSDGGTCHSVKVGPFENPWGQYWEMRGGMCSSTTDNKVWLWNSNFIPPTSGTPDSATFQNIDHVVVTRATAENSSNVNLAVVGSTDKYQGLYPVPTSTASGISYGDHYWYAATGQLWLFGGFSLYGAHCGLVSASSDCVWSYSRAYISARLAYYGQARHVTDDQLKAIVA